MDHLDHSVSGAHVVRQGECLSSIAEATGHFWQTLWNDPANLELKSLRGDPNVLAPGDRIVIPPLRQQTAECVTGRRHVFRRRGVPARLRVRIAAAGRPLGGAAFRVAWGGVVTSGTLDPDGGLDVAIPRGVTRAVLHVETDAFRHDYTLALGELDPITTLRGVASRLNNLGLSCTAADGELGPAMETALREFQTRHGLPVTGAPTEETLQRLVEIHGS